MKRKETELFKKLHQDSLNNGDTNSCTVLSSCVALDLTYQQGYNFLERFAGRIKRKGCYRFDLFKIYPKINEYLNVKGKFEFKHYDQTELRRKFTRGETMTVNNCTQFLNPKKRYIIYVTHHAVGVKNNVVHDWTRGSKKRVQDVLEVTCKDEYEEVKPKSKTFKAGGFASVLANL
tara:strand:+ start:230 stop:757 length:528 start_codon:yes stop_codon:yes gene_type:complete